MGNNSVVFRQKTNSKRRSERKALSSSTVQLVSENEDSQFDRGDSSHTKNDLYEQVYALCAQNDEVWAFNKEGAIA